MTEPAEPPPSPALHPQMGGLRFLLGTWAGEGTGRYETIEDFRYGEEIKIGHTGKPFLTYRQRTWSLDDGRPLHSETGFWRASDGSVELLVVHPTGVAEVEEGRLDGQSVDLHSTVVAHTPTAKTVESLSRHIAVHDDTLTYSLDMGAVGRRHQNHLTATLHRRPA